MKILSVLLMFCLLFAFSCGRANNSQSGDFQPEVSVAPAVETSAPPPETKKFDPEEGRRRWVEENTQKAEGLREKWSIADSPKGIPETATDYNWSQSLALALDSMQKEAEFGDQWKEKRFPIMGAYGVLQQIGMVDTVKLRRAVTGVFLSRTSREIAYRFAMPAIQKAFAEMYPQDKRDYLVILRHARRYMDTANFKLEEAYLQSLKSDKGCQSEEWQKKFYWLLPEEGGCDERFFNYRDPRGGDDKFRKIETFIYRRVVEDRWPLADMKSALDRLINDLEKVAVD